MQIKATIIVALSITLAACSHTQSHVTLPSSNDSIPADSQADSRANSSSVNASVSANNDSNHQDEAIQTNADLLAKLRAGFTFPDLDSKYIAQYEKWNSEHPTYLNDLFKRAEPFLYHILQEIEKRNLPTELALLPAIESSYKPLAVSRSGAVGLWQFIRSTGRAFGLNQTWWYDGRRDALSATSAALDYLTELNNQFNGDWFLTLAAYNAGPGTVQRAITRNKRKGKGTHYQDLSLRSETIRYVPKLIALKNIIKNPDQFSVSLPSIANQPYFEVVEFSEQINLDAFNKFAGISQELFQHLNAGYLQWASPPQGPHRLLMPLWNHPQTSVAKQTLLQSPQVQFRRHTIRSGESLSSIAAQHNVSVNALKSTNNLSSSYIRAGKTLMVPVSAQTGNAISSAPLATDNNDHNNGQLIHRVVKGDTLWSISRRYKVPVKQLLALNELAANSILKLNQALLVFKN